MTRDSRSSVGSTAWLCAAAVLGVAFVRMTTIASGDLPYWFTDPWVERTPEATITPMVSLLLDAMVWLGAAGMIAHEHTRGRRIPRWTLGAILAGAMVVGLQGFILRSPEAMPDGVRGHFGSFLLGSVWVSAMLGAWTLSIAARERAIRDAALSIILASAVLFALKAVVNVTIEHGALASDYRESPAAFLARNGIEPGTPEAAVYERRLLEPQATGWIALSNAFGTVAAALTLGIGAMTLRAWHARKPVGLRGAQIAGLVVLLALAGLALFLSRSKGAAVSLAYAAGLLVLLGFMRNRVPRKWLIVTMVLATLAPLGAVVARGLMGDQLGERSLLFRWQYLIGATRIIGEHPLVGVGADGFKSAYLQARVPDAVEEVSSPHSVMFDWVACLGLAGAAWCGVWFAWIAQGVRRALTPTDEVHEPMPRDGFRADALTLGVVGFAGFVSLWSESAALTEVTAGLHLIGFLVWVAAARGIRLVIVGLSDRAVATAALGAAMVIAVHAQMEVTPVIVGSAGLALAMLGLAAAFTDERPARAGGHRSALLPGMAGLLAAGGVAVGGYSLVTVRGWESRLRWSAIRLSLPRHERGIPIHGDEFIDTGVLGWMKQNPNALFATIRFEIQNAVGWDTGGMEPEMIVRLLLMEGGPVRLSEVFITRWPSLPVAWIALARTQELVFRTGAGGREWFERALESWRRVAELDPQGIRPVFEMWRLQADGGVGGQAPPSPENAELARQILEMDEKSRRMDPLRGLSPAEREVVERWIAGGEVAGGEE